MNSRSGLDNSNEVTYLVVVVLMVVLVVVVVNSAGGVARSAMLDSYR